MTVAHGTSTIFLLRGSFGSNSASAVESFLPVLMSVPGAVALRQGAKVSGASGAPLRILVTRHGDAGNPPARERGERSDHDVPGPRDLDKPERVANNNEDENGQTQHGAGERAPGGCASRQNAKQEDAEHCSVRDRGDGQREHQDALV